jgi:hypothetical protein
MTHRGKNGGKKWAILTLKKNINGEEYWATKIIEKFAGTDVVVFNSISVAQKLWPNDVEDSKRGYFLRPQRCVELFEDFLANNKTFDYEVHALNVNNKYFSFNKLKEGFAKISALFNEPLVFRNSDKDVKH